MHLIIPGVIAYIFFKQNWKKVWIIFLLTMFIDFDHLIASPIFSATRCSINYHPLHSYYAIAIYLVLSFISKTRIIAIGLLFHMLSDFIDCLWIK